ncbi:MAG: cupin domain-containing protein [Planctomycetia bacterium]|nr:cupin domain-containing protein [Planctomycetia bacterium]
MRIHRSTVVVGLVALGLALGWAKREHAHADEKAKQVPSKTINLADIKLKEFAYEGKPRGEIGVYFEGETAGTRNFVVGQVRLKPGEEPHPIHTHPEEEVLIVTGGKGVIHCDGKDTPVANGSVMYTAPNAGHTIKNTGTDVLTFYYIKWIGVATRK